jgi:hypothetical protein
VFEYDQTELRVPSVNHDPVAPLWNNHWDLCVRTPSLPVGTFTGLGH